MINFEKNDDMGNAFIYISISKQVLSCYYRDNCLASYSISSGKNGVGELENSECTPRGWHDVADVIGLDAPLHAIFVGRVWTGKIYSKDLELQFPNRDWILTRILRLSGLEPGYNLGGRVDTYNRYIYIHGTSDEENLGVPRSHGCIRMHNRDVIELANWAKKGMKVFIDESFTDCPEKLNNWSKES
jgi:hypothetical protein